MDYDNGFILQKTVDWSLLNDGMTIPVSVCSLFYPTTSTTSPVRRTTTPRTSLSSALTTIVLSTRTIRGSIARSSSSSLRMARC